LFFILKKNKFRKLKEISLPFPCPTKSIVEFDDGLSIKNESVGGLDKGSSVWPTKSLSKIKSTSCLAYSV
jgi:hypothetical protein